MADVSQFWAFWKECIALGGGICWNTFLLVDSICILVASGLLWRKFKYRQRWNQWETVVMKWAFAFLVCTIVASIIAIAPYIKHQNSLDSERGLKKQIAVLKKDLETERDKGLPKLSAKILHQLWGNPAKISKLSPTQSVVISENKTEVILTVDMRNMGAPSIAENYELKVVTDSTNTFLGRLTIDTPTEPVIRMMEGETNVFDLTDSIFEKTSHPITNGDSVKGWIMFVFEGTKLMKTPPEKRTLVFSFVDTLGRRIYVTNADFLSYRGPTHYVPGSKYPSKTK
jgi:hypothetical protein